MVVEPEIEFTADGSPTMRHPVLGEYYHSLRGAEGEARHVFIAAGFDSFEAERVRLLEIGFGSGLNAWLTLLRACQTGRSVDYTAVELYPMGAGSVTRLPYYADVRFAAMHSAEWGRPVDITDRFRLHKIEADVAAERFEGPFDVVYFDAFAPDCQPALWSEEVFAGLYRAMSSGGILVTYSSKGDVKRAMRAAGFEVRRLPGALGKRHMVRAVKI